MCCGRTLHKIPLDRNRGRVYNRDMSVIADSANPISTGVCNTPVGSSDAHTVRPPGLNLPGVFSFSQPFPPSGSRNEDLTGSRRSPKRGPGRSSFLRPLLRIGDVMDGSGAGVFTPEEILEANRRHDRYYGWSFEFPSLYTNLARLPETTLGRPGWE